MDRQAPPPAAGNLATYSRYGLAAVAWLFAAGVVVQVFLVGLNVFDSPVRWDDHRTFGNMIGLLTYLFPVLALIGRAGWRVVALAFGLLILFHLQYPLANADTGWVAALHAVNALVMGGLAPQLGRIAFSLARTRARPGLRVTTSAFEAGEPVRTD